MSKTGRRKKISPVLYIPLAILAAFLLFIGIFYVPESNAAVTGNTRYTTSEIRKMVLNSFVDHNSLYLSIIEKNIVPEDAPFVESIDIIYEGHNRVTLHVNENSPIGYVEQKGMDYYFDAKGYVLEAIAVEGYDPEAEAAAEAAAAEALLEEAAQATSAEEEDPYADYVPLIDLNEDGIYDITQYEIYLMDTDGDGYPDMSTQGEELADTDGDGIPDASPSHEAEEEVAEEEVVSESEEEAVIAESVDETETSSSEADASGALQAVMEKTSDTEFHPALTDVTRITGLTEQELKVGDTIETEDDSIFSTIQALTKIVSKLSIKPDSIALDEKYNMTLYYGEITVMIGQDSLLEEKMSRVSAILPKLEGKAGTLHLETFTSDTVNIVFEAE